MSTAARIPHLAPPPAAITYAPIAVTLIPASESAAAILRLAAAHGLEVEVEAISTGDAPRGEPMAIEFTGRLVGGDHPVRLSQGDMRVVLDVLGRMVAAPASPIVTLADARVAATTAEAGGVQIIHPADRTGDPYYRPPADEPRTDEPVSSLFVDQPTPASLATARAVLDRLATDARLADAVRHLLRPLVEQPLGIDGNIDQVLTRAANDVATVRRSQLVVMARRFADSRHRKFPDRHELMAALGEVVAGAPTHTEQEAAP